MLPDREGFLYPEVDPGLCTGCGLCEMVCPMLAAGSAPEGDGRKVFAALSPDTACTADSSSGGAWYELASLFIRNGGVAYGAAYDADLTVRHIRAGSMEELRRTQGSKYVQSDMDGILQSIKSDFGAGRKVLFSGTPCQVMAVTLAAGKRRDLLYTADFTCHGVPSPMCFRDFLDFASRYTGRKVDGYTMRDKRDVSGFFKATLLLEGRELYDRQISNLWHKMYFSDMITRPSCHACPFATAGRHSDLTLGDFRGDASRHSALFDQARGVSQVIVNTPRGAALLEGSGLMMEEASGEDLHQPHLKAPSRPSPLRESLWEEYDRRDFRRIAVKYWGFGKWNIIKRRLKLLFER